MHPRRGFIFQDTLVGLALIVILAASLAYTTVHHSRATRQLADIRTAVSVAETTLLAMQAEQPLPQLPTEMTRTIRTIPAATITAEAPPTLDRPTAPPTPPRAAWVQVTVTYRQRHAALTGLVPVAAVPQEAQP